MTDQIPSPADHIATWKLPPGGEPGPGQAPWSRFASTDAAGDTPADAPGEQAGDQAGEQAGDQAPDDQAPESGGAASSDTPEEDQARPAIQRRPPVMAPRPPRRTGVFVDHEELRDHVGDLLRAILGGYEVDAVGNFTFLHESVKVVVTVGPSPIGPHVGVLCVTNLDLDLSPDLAEFLLTTNHSLGFGAFSYDLRNRAVWLRHFLLGSTLDLPELQAAVAAVATAAARFDQVIQERFGGRTFAEAPSDMQQRMSPPEPSSSPGDAPNASGYL